MVEQLIVKEEQEYSRLDEKWRKSAEQALQQIRENSDEYNVAYNTTFNTAGPPLMAVRERLSALGVTLPPLPKYRENWGSGPPLTPEEEEELKKVQQEYQIQRVRYKGRRDWALHKSKGDVGVALTNEPD